MGLIQQSEFWQKKMDIIHKVSEENGHAEQKSALPTSACGQPFKSPCSEFTAKWRSPWNNRQPEKRLLKPLVFLDVIFWAFLSGKIGHPLRER